MHEVSYGWAQRGTDLVHRTSGAVLRSDAEAGWERPEELAEARLGAMGDNQLSRNVLLTWLRDQGALEGSLPGLPQGLGWQPVTDARSHPVGVEQPGSHCQAAAGAAARPRGRDRHALPG